MKQLIRQAYEMASYENIKKVQEMASFENIKKVQEMASLENLQEGFQASVTGLQSGLGGLEAMSKTLMDNIGNPSKLLVCSSST